MVTIIIPTFNCENTIIESLKSTLQAGQVVSEVVICDDGSNDKTVELVNDFLKTESFTIRISLIKHENNKGGAAARNSAVEFSNNEWIFCLDSDNILNPGTIDYLYKKSQEYKVFDIISFRRIIFFVDCFDNFRLNTHSWIFPSGEYFLSDHLSNNESPGSSGNYLFSKLAWLKAGKYRLNSRSLDSWCFGFDALLNGVRMYVVDDQNYFYLHRYGLQSYWVRESLNIDINKLATELLLRSNLIGHTDFKIAQIKKDNWFYNLNTEPLMIVKRRPTLIRKIFGLRIILWVVNFCK